MKDKLVTIFYGEAHDLLDKLEDHLLELEQRPEDAETISSVFRIMHTIKGSSAMFGLNAISRFTHEVESTFDEVRSGRISVTPQLISATLASRDHILMLLESDNPQDGDEGLDKEGQRLISLFKSFWPQNDQPGADNEDGLSAASAKEESADRQPTEQQAADCGQKINIDQKTASESARNNGIEDIDKALDQGNPAERTWRIFFKPSPQIFQNGTNLYPILKELSELGQTTVSIFVGDVPPLKDINPELCYLSWQIILTTKASLNDIQDVFVFFDSTSVIDIQLLASHGNEQPEYKKKLGEILVEKKLVNKETIENALSGQKPLGQILSEQKIVSKEHIQAALAEQKHISDLKEKKTLEVSAQTIKVSSEKLDKLIDLVGELVTFNARLGQLSHDIHQGILSSLSEQGERLIIELRSVTMEMRMLPIGTIFTRYRRLVRDLSSSLQKEIELVTEGAETELDKTVIDKLNDPLVHLIRNSIDHGIELPAARTAAGKPAQGTILLKAEHTGAFVQITISDDGAGLNKEKIHRKAVEKGLIQSQDELTDTQIWELIFMPSFSTAETVTSVSGRGVGMDVVKKDIAALGGSIATTSCKGKGTRFELKIPLTLAIIEGFLVQIGSSFYVIPLSNVVECLEFNRTEGQKRKMCSSVKIRDEIVPYTDLRVFFNIQDPPVQYEQLVIVTDHDSRIGLVIDKVIGNYQTVIKPLGRLYKHIPGLSGATILGDGSVALILDVYKLSDTIRERDAERGSLLSGLTHER